MAGTAGVTIVKSRAERSTDRQSDIIVQEMVAVVRRGDSADDEGACAGVALSTTLPGGSMRGSEVRLFVMDFGLDIENILVSLKTLDIVKAK
jgi:hypothetical protein